MAIKKTYMQMQTDLDYVLEQLQSENLDVDKAIELYKKGQILVEKLEEYLKTAKNEIENIKK